jgi:hypothetical protein
MNNKIVKLKGINTHRQGIQDKNNQQTGGALPDLKKVILLKIPTIKSTFISKYL